MWRREPNASSVSAYFPISFRSSARKRRSKPDELLRGQQLPCFLLRHGREHTASQSLAASNRRATGFHCVARFGGGECVQTRRVSRAVCRRECHCGKGES